MMPVVYVGDDQHIPWLDPARLQKKVGVDLMGLLDVLVPSENAKQAHQKEQREDDKQD